MAVTEEECESMIEAAEANGVKLMIAYRLHFEKGNLEAAQLAQSGELGDPRFFSSDFAQQVVENNIRVTEPVEKGGRPVYDMGAIASTPPVICSGLSLHRSWRAAQTTASPGSKKSTR